MDLTIRELRDLHVRLVEDTEREVGRDTAVQIARCDLYLVGRDMRDFSMAMADNFPDKWVTQKPPMADGLMVFDSPSRPDGIAGILWRTRPNGEVFCIQVNGDDHRRLYNSFPFVLGDEGHPRVEPHIAKAIREQVGGEPDDFVKQMHSWSQTIWALCRQKLASTETSRAPKASRNGIKVSRSNSVIRLRERERRSVEQSTSVDWSCRWLVKAHWRNQAYGSDRSQRRWVLISAHIKGPEDKPFVANKIVRWVVD